MYRAMVMGEFRHPYEAEKDFFGPCILGDWKYRKAEAERAQLNEWAQQNLERAQERRKAWDLRVEKLRDAYPSGRPPPQRVFSAILSVMDSWGVKTPEQLGAALSEAGGCGRFRAEPGCGPLVLNTALRLCGLDLQIVQEQKDEEGREAKARTIFRSELKALEQLGRSLNYHQLDLLTRKLDKLRKAAA